MSKYRTAMGKSLDMTALAAKNEHTRAVGNMKVNARGDLIDDRGTVVKSINERVNDRYTKTVGNKGAQVIPSGVNQQIQPKYEVEELSDLEKELESNLEDDLRVEKIKEEEMKKNGR